MGKTSVGLDEKKVAAHTSEREVASQLRENHAKGRGRVNTVSVIQSYSIDTRFDQALKLIRQALAKGQLSIAGEYDLAEYWAEDSGEEPTPARLLLVDSPLLLFEALALDRAAGVFLPLHLLVSADGDRTQVICIEPSSAFEVRLPPGSAQPLQELGNRVALTLESIKGRFQFDRKDIL